jgi:hypothetical protein
VRAPGDVAAYVAPVIGLWSFLAERPSGTDKPGSVGKTMPQPRSSASRRHDRGSEIVKPPKTGAETSEKAAAAALTLQFLGFVADGRTYGETMEAWRSTCPRMPIWEDAVRDGLVRIENGGAMKSSRIVLTARGKARLGRNKT